jgi:SAM-dependent methyltransferase
MTAREIGKYIWHEECPLCLSSQISKVGRLNYQGCVPFSTTAIELSKRPELWSCESCESQFTQNAIDEASAKQLYGAGEAADRWAALPFDQVKTRSVVAALTQLFEQAGTVLDVGANTGELLDFARNLGSQTAGVEYSHNSRFMLEAKGHEAFADMSEAGSQYDLISAFDLIEHLYDVPAFFQACHDKLVAGGQVVLLTGDISSRSARLALENWWYMQYPEHIVFPSRAYLDTLAGFRLKMVLPVFASVGYEWPWALRILQSLRTRILGRRYAGLPAIGPDHMLVILEKL